MTRAYSYIRISSQNQIKGEGVRRQLEASRLYAEANGLIIDEELTDIGLSGFKGTHRKSGELGDFLAAVKEGKVPTGSVLIIESLDRLSRENILTAQGQLLSLLGSGVDVVTLIDKQRYSSNPDLGQLIVSLTIMARAHEESVTKSERSKAFLEMVRADILNGEKRWVRGIVSWIDQTRIGDTKTFEFTLNEKASTVGLIFDLYDQGLGSYKIAQALNRRSFPRFGSTKRSDNPYWSTQTVLQVLKHPAAAGHHKVGSTIVRDYFPAAVEADLYQRVHQALNRPKPGRTGNAYTNLLGGGLMRCEKCGSNIRLIHSSTVKRSYVGCGSRFKGVPCSEKSKRGKLFLYDVLEKAVLDHIGVFLSVEQTPSGSIETINERIATLTSEIEVLNADIDLKREILGETKDAEDRAHFWKLIDGLRDSRAAIEASIAKLKLALNDLTTGLNNTLDTQNVIKSERDRWASISGAELYHSRAKVAKILRTFISTIRMDFEERVAYVAVGGVTKGWVINREGNIIHQFDLSHLPVDRLLKMAENVGIKTTKSDIKRVWDDAADHREKVNSETDEIMRKIGAGKRK